MKKRLEERRPSGEVEIANATVSKRDSCREKKSRLPLEVVACKAMRLDLVRKPTGSRSVHAMVAKTNFSAWSRQTALITSHHWIRLEVLGTQMNCKPFCFLLLSFFLFFLWSRCWTNIAIPGGSNDNQSDAWTKYQCMNYIGWKLHSVRLREWPMSLRGPLTLRQADTGKPESSL